MKRLFTVFLLLGLSIHLTAQAKIEFIQTTHDFGLIEEGDNATYLFIFKNIGTDTLQIESVRPSCGCTSPYWAKDPVLPGETGEIKVQYNSKGRIGAFYKSINIVSNSIEPNKQLKIGGLVVPPLNDNISQDSISKSPVIEILSTKYVLGEIEERKKESFKILVKNTGKAPLVIKKVQAGSGWFYSPETPTTIAIGELKEITINITPNQEGKMEAIVLIQSNDPVSPYTAINVEAVIKKSLRQENLLQTNPGSGF